MAAFLRPGRFRSRRAPTSPGPGGPLWSPIRPFASIALSCIGVVLVLAALAGRPPAASAGSADPILPQQWALEKIHAPDAWSTSTGEGVVVAVVDSGVDFDHEDLRGQSAGSFTCVGTCVPGGGDVAGHGTQVASIIAAASNNGIGIASVAPGAKILSVRVLDAAGTGSIGDVSQGIRFAADHGAKVINISIGTTIDLPIVFGLLNADLQSAVTHAWSKGAVVVAAAGNGGLASSYTAMQNLLVVGATGPDDEIAGYSSSLTGVVLHAPGGDHAGDRCTAVRCITAAEPPNIYRAVEGTSFAAPHVSGVAAQLIALGRSNADVVARLKSTADPVGGVLRLNAAKAVGPPPPRPPSPPPSPPAPPLEVKGIRTPAPAPSPSPVPPVVPSPAPSPEPSLSPSPAEPSPSPSTAAAAPPPPPGSGLPLLAGGLLLAATAGGALFLAIRRRG